MSLSVSCTNPTMPFRSNQPVISLKRNSAGSSDSFKANNSSVAFTGGVKSAIKASLPVVTTSVSGVAIATYAKSPSVRSAVNRAAFDQMDVLLREWQHLTPAQLGHGAIGLTVLTLTAAGLCYVYKKALK